ncbi:MAG: hypothetical protein PWQ75_860 [Methanolobus sp.]|uniref:hypothetical protein n=1 Tax=Methanolobus sp. TaxID=1874737 RepID=UPI0024AB35F5|nr:hypothetical protein [Methanolobus sp.]MDI3485229.1 hypothetical protein [Methanolobus sp.]MDK2831108.1 hypothetical protein [Methanolobus sp.]
MSNEVFTSFNIILSTGLTLYFYKNGKTDPQTIKYNIKGISKLFLFFEYYYKLLPLFLISFCFALTIISVTYQLELLAVIGLLLILILILYIYFSLIFAKGYYGYNVGLYLNLEITRMILTNYIHNKKNVDLFFIRKFIQFFKLFLENLDTELDKGVKIKNLKLQENYLSIKQIILYSTPYLKYGSSVELQLLKDNLDQMQDLIAQNNKIRSLEIANNITNIYNLEKNWILKYNYEIEPKSPLSCFYEDIKQPLIFTVVIISFIIFVITKTNIATNVMSDYLKKEYVEILLQPFALLFTAILGIIGIILKIVLESYRKK